MTDQVVPEVIAEARAWAAECTWREAEDAGETGPQYVGSLSDEAVLAGVEQHYSGGVQQLARDAGLETVE